MPREDRGCTPPPGQEKGVASSASAAGSTPTLTMCLATASPSPSYSSWSPRRKAMPKEKRTADSISPGGWFGIKFGNSNFFKRVGPLDVSQFSQSYMLINFSTIYSG